MVIVVDDYVTASGVLARMRRGDLPTPRGAGGFTACFEDGALVKPQTIRKLEQAGKIERPTGGSMARPYTLTEAGKDASKPMDAWGALPVAFRSAFSNESEKLAKDQADSAARAWRNCQGDYQPRIFRAHREGGRRRGRGVRGRGAGRRPVMACMCGDICCSSCGPAQGNSRCPICREWVSEGCEHVDDGGSLKPEHQAEAERIAAADAAAEDDISSWEDQTTGDTGEDKYGRPKGHDGGQ